jgi:hypothetical protein
LRRGSIIFGHLALQVSLGRGNNPAGINPPRNRHADSKLLPSTQPEWFTASQHANLSQII